MEEASQLLRRLPKLAPNILTTETARALCRKSYRCYLLQNIHSRKKFGHDRLELVWMQLCVTRKLNSVVLRLALHIAYQKNRRGATLKIDEIANATLELLRVTFGIAARDQNENRITWTIVKAYVWNTWQRIVILYFYHIYEMYGNLSTNGYPSKECAIKLSELQGIELIPELSRLRHADLSRQLKAIPYLCSWSYRLLFETYYSLTTDFSCFFQSYSRLHSKKIARCNGVEQCDGSSPAMCQRFISDGVINQSAHDSSCLGNCRKLSWDEESFRSIHGARAVDVRETEETLQYKPVDERTMAISHVWSHGQGGRPEPWTPHMLGGTGFNSCLHRRYADLACKFGCSSYWMDTPCVPSETSLKNECIQHINEIFARSKVTLICDRDIMDININDPCVEKLESLLATLLVCDWNLRAWTLLEGMRGRANLHLLCKNNYTIPVMEVLQTIYRRGRIDLTFMIMGSQHLIPEYEYEMDLESFDVWGDLEDSHSLELVHFLPIGDAAMLLSHRHMTRNMDDVIIWGYLTGDTTFRDAVKLWRSRIGQKICTGSIVSSSPRIKGHKGLGWAPERPTFRYAPGSTLSKKAYVASIVATTVEGEILAEGLRAIWFFHELIMDGDGSKAQFEALHVAALEVIRRHQSEYAHFALLQACPQRGRGAPAVCRETEHGPLVVLCASQDPQEGWHWIDVFEWNNSRSLPEFESKIVLLI